MVHNPGIYVKLDALGIRNGARIVHMDTSRDEVRMQAVAATLRAERAASGLTQKEVAGRARMPTITYTRYENAARRPTVIQVMAIADALGLTFTAFARKVDDREAQLTAVATQQDVDLAADQAPGLTDDERLRLEHPDDEVL